MAWQVDLAHTHVAVAILHRGISLIRGTMRVAGPTLDPDENNRSAEKLSVRAAEVLAKVGDGPKRERDAGLEAIEKTAAVRDLELRLTRTLGTKVEVRPKTATKGAVSIPYEDLDALDRLLQKLGVDQG